MSEPQINGGVLKGVSETTLWTLYSRAKEAGRSRPLIDDPMAIHLVDQIDYDFRVFDDAARPRSIQGALRPTAQYFAVRALTFDRVIKSFLRRHTRGTVVALAEGLQTSFWRVNSPTVRWISLDLPPVIVLREKLLPPSPQVTNLPVSALDNSWLAQLDPESPTLITAEGLLMYLQRGQVLTLINDCARRVPGGQMLVDIIPPGGKSAQGWQLTSSYRTPPMTFGLTSGQARALSKRIPTLESATTVPFAKGRGLRGKALQVLPHYPVLSHLSASVTLLQFGTRPNS